MTDPLASNPPPTSQHEGATEIPWFQRMPTGGTAYVSRDVVTSWFKRMPNGGTTYVDPTPSVRNVTARVATPPVLPTGGGTRYARRADAGGETGTAGKPD